MAGGLVGLLDDVAALAKLAAASVDDVGAAAGKVSLKAAGVVVDDTAVTPTYVHGLAAKRELPIIRRIALGSIRNKIVFITPAALMLSEWLPTLVEVILICGGTYLCFEGAHKIHHALSRHNHDDTHEVPTSAAGPQAEEETIQGAIRTDFILSTEIMVIALKEVIDQSFLDRAIILVIVALVITAAVYGVVAVIVKMDDIGLALAGRESDLQIRIGRLLVKAMPQLLQWLTVVGTAAMVWVGGHILLAGSDELGWQGPYDLVHRIQHSVADVGALSGVFEWLINTTLSAFVGLVVGFAVVAVVAQIQRRRGSGAGASLT